MAAKKFSIIDRIKSFRYAFSGLRVLFREEHNARVHLAITFLVIVLGVFFGLNTVEWVIIALTVGFVFVTEILNTAIEDIADFISPQRDIRIKRIKDLGAAAVLIAAIAAVLVGILIFLPKLLNYLFP